MTRVLWLAIAIALARTAAAGPSAEEVVEQARDARRAANLVQTVRMVRVSKRGSERVRTYELKSRRDGDVVKSHTRFLEPADVAGTQLVLVDLPDSDDEQLMYLPALERVNRIAGSSRSGSFMGSDFAFEDFELNDDAGDTHTIVEETDELDCRDVIWAGEDGGCDPRCGEAGGTGERPGEHPGHAGDTVRVPADAGGPLDGGGEVVAPAEHRGHR